MTGISNYMSALEKVNKLFTHGVILCSLKLLYSTCDLILSLYIG